MADWATKLQGLGESLAGRGNQWRLAQEAQKRTELDARRMDMIEDQYANQERMFANLSDTRKMIAAANGGDIDAVRQVLGERIAALQASGGDPSHSIASFELLNRNPQAWLQDVTVGEQMMSERLRVPSMFGEPTATHASAKTTHFDNGTVVTTRSDGSTEVFAPDGTKVTGSDRVAVLQAARNEQVSHAGLKSEAGAMGAGEGQRAQSVIDFGYDAAKGYPIIKRSLDLLNEVSTGGYDAAALKAKQLFGVESADEAELSSNLGKAVLSQLKATFGAQFTEKEGSRLERIEAGFSKSTEGNKRLLTQLLNMSDRYINDAISRAAKSGDYATVDELRGYMSMDLTPVAPAEAKEDPLGLR